jgi:hypothetical protein
MSLLPFNSGMSGIAAEPWKCSKVARVPIASSRFRNNSKMMMVLVLVQLESAAPKMVKQARALELNSSSSRMLKVILKLKTKLT